MKNVQFILCAALLGLGSFAVAAEGSGPTCNPQGNQMEMNACAADNFAHADAALNQTYKDLMARLDQHQQGVLRAEQRQWLRHRDPSCKAKTKEYEGGSIWPLEYLSCRTELTQKRTQELQAWKVKP